MAFVPDVSEEDIKRERSAARVLRSSAWWKNRLSRGKCYYCGVQTPPRDLTMDHIVPIIRGGKSVKNNVVTACKECNNRKKNLLPIEWDEYLSSL
jgi:5-methylcytosine-specific restriction enzyme A